MIVIINSDTGVAGGRLRRLVISGAQGLSMARARLFEKKASDGEKRVDSYSR
jgi:hypothetical protein